MKRLPPTEKTPVPPSNFAKGDGHPNPLMQIYGPALEIQGVLRTLNERAGGVLFADTVLSAVLERLGREGADPERAAEDIARVLGELPDRVFNLGLSAERFADLIHLQINGRIHPTILGGATLAQIDGLINTLLTEERQYREVQREGRSRLHREQRPPAPPRTAEPQAPIDIQRANLVREAVEQNGENARRQAEDRVIDLIMWGQVDRLNALGQTNEALANGVLREMLVADQNYRETLQAIPDDLMLRIFTADPAWRARQFMALLQAVASMVEASEHNIRNFIEEQLEYTKGRK